MAYIQFSPLSFTWLPVSQLMCPYTFCHLLFFTDTHLEYCDATSLGTTNGLADPNIVRVRILGGLSLALSARQCPDLTCTLPDSRQEKDKKRNKQHQKNKNIMILTYTFTSCHTRYATSLRGLFPSLLQTVDFSVLAVHSQFHCATSCSSLS